MINFNKQQYRADGTRNTSTAESPERYAPLMTRPPILFLVVLLLIACETKQKTKQWNLNQTIGWKSENPNDFTVLYVKWNRMASDSSHLINKKKFDEAILKELKAKRLGNQAENDEKTETDIHFVVPNEYQNVIAIIRSVAKTNDIEQNITVYLRDYKSYDKWTDVVVYPE